MGLNVLLIQLSIGDYTSKLTGTKGVVGSGGLGAGTPGKIPEWVTFWPPGPLVHYNKLTKFRNV